MAIDVTLLEQSLVLQDYFVDKDTGTPLAAGKITLYKDNDRQQLKNWYYQSNSATSPPTFVALANPLTLSSYGTIQDPNGNDVIPFFYPYDEDNSQLQQSYFIKVESSGAILQFTRENFPYQADISPSGDTNPTLDNLIVNGEYWHNIGSLDATNILNTVIAGSQHDNYNTYINVDADTIGTVPSGRTPQEKVLDLGSSDIRFLKDLKGDADTITFKPMGELKLISGHVSSIPPATYLNFRCTTASGSATFKCVQYPVSMHIDSLKGQSAHFIMWARNVSGNNNKITVMLYRYTGAGNTAASSEFPIDGQTGEFTLTSGNFSLVSSTFIFPDDEISTAGSGGDDAWFIRVYYQVGSEAEVDIDHTKPQLFLGDSISENSFRTYDEINSIVNAPRTGDTRMVASLYSYFANSTLYPLYGWLPMDNGTIGNTSSSASTRANQDTWQLFNLLWQANQGTQGYAPMYTSAGVQTQYGATAIDDFKNNRRLSLLRALGNVLAGTVKHYAAAETFTDASASGTLEITVADSSLYGNGSPVIFFTTGGTLPQHVDASEIYYTFIPPTDTTGTKLYLYAEKEDPAAPTTAAVKPWEYSRLKDVRGATDAALSSTYANGTSGVGATLTNNGAQAQFTTDGLTYTNGQIVLVKDQSNPKENGIYEVTDQGSGSTNWVLTRATYFDQPKEMFAKAYVFTSDAAASANGNKNFALDAGVVVIDGSSGSDINFSEVTFTLVTAGTVGSGSNYIQLYVKNLAQYGGEFNHQLVNPELPNPVGTGQKPEEFGGSGGNSAMGNAAGGFLLQNIGGNNTHNNTQPTTFFNIYIKL